MTNKMYAPKVESVAVGRPSMGVDKKKRQKLKGTSGLILADKLIQARQDRGLTQAVLAHASGLGVNRIIRMEKVTTDVKMSTVAKVASALGLQPWELLKP